jgi:hypothetical protein
LGRRRGEPDTGRRISTGLRSADGEFFVQDSDDANDDVANDDDVLHRLREQRG